MQVNVETDAGTIRTKIENFQSFTLSSTVFVTVADYIDSDRSLVLLQFGDDLEFINSYQSRTMARIHARQIKAAATGREGVIGQS